MDNSNQLHSRNQLKRKCKLNTTLKSHQNIGKAMKIDKVICTCYCLVPICWVPQIFWKRYRNFLFSVVLLWSYLIDTNGKIVIYSKWSWWVKFYSIFVVWKCTFSIDSRKIPNSFVDRDFSYIHGIDSMRNCIEYTTIG